MYIETVDSYEELSEKAGGYIVKAIEAQNDLLLCAATGNSPTGAYQFMEAAFLKKPDLFSSFRVIKLDEWGGVPSNQKGTCENYLQEKLIVPLQIDRSRYISFKSDSVKPEKECEAIQEKLRKEGPIDLCILGLGRNGHLALNEPGDFLHASCHIAELSEMSMQHQMTAEMNVKPEYGLTLGMADILASKQILILINGIDKKLVVEQFLSKKITTALPASFLWLHPNVICLIEKEIVGDI